jgi:hypothetical protein
VRAPALAPHRERAALRGSALKHKATYHARRLLAGGLDEAAKDAVRHAREDCLLRAIAAYQSGEGGPGSDGLRPCHALNRLALDALTDWASPDNLGAAVELAQQCRRAAEQGFNTTPNLWDAVTQPEALLIERVLDGQFSQSGEAGRAVFEEVARAYADAMLNITIKPSQIEAMVSQMELMSRLCDALSVLRFGDEALARTATRLLDLVQRVQPGRAPRRDRPHARANNGASPTQPVPPATEKATRQAPAKAAAKKAAAKKTAAKKAAPRRVAKKASGRPR